MVLNAVLGGGQISEIVQLVLYPTETGRAIIGKMEYGVQHLPKEFVLKLSE